MQSWIIVLIDSRAGVVPGAVITELWDKMGQSQEQQKANFEKAAEKLSVGFVATPEDVSLPCVASLPLLRWNGNEWFYKGVQVLTKRLDC